MPSVEQGIKAVTKTLVFCCTQGILLPSFIGTMIIAIIGNPINQPARWNVIRVLNVAEILLGAVLKGTRFIYLFGNPVLCNASAKTWLRASFDMDASDLCITIGGWFLAYVYSLAEHDLL